MILAPQLQQSLKLLQVPTMELQALIAQQLATNPTLEEYDPILDIEELREMGGFDPDAQDLAGRREERGQTVAKDSREFLEDPSDPEQIHEKKLDRLTGDDENWKSYYDSANLYSGYTGRPEAVAYRERRPSDDEEYAFRIQSIPARRSLVDELREQYLSLDLSEEDNEILEYLIGSLENSGFLRETSGEIGEALKKEPAHIERLVNLLKTFDPPGIGAKDPRECLLTQLERQGKKDSRAYRLIEQFYADLLHNHLERVARGLGVSLEELHETIQEIGHLDPRPGRDLSTDTAPHIKPDIIVTRGDDGSYQVETNDNLLPYIRISPRIRNLVKNKAFDKQNLRYMRQEMRDGETLLNNLQFRKRTILAVAEAIVEAQKTFFMEGPTHLRPLNMKEIADKVGVHEATVSRTVNEKYMDTPQGLYEMRYFFSSHVANVEGNEVSTNAVKAKLKELIREEDKRRPYSDAKLAELLKEKGFPVARRTVVKYRKALDIPNMRQRKVFV